MFGTPSTGEYQQESIHNSLLTHTHTHTSATQGKRTLQSCPSLGQKASASCDAACLRTQHNTPNV
jgi:hypothetical protein